MKRQSLALRVSSPTVARGDIETIDASAALTALPDLDKPAGRPRCRQRRLACWLSRQARPSRDRVSSVSRPLPRGRGYRVTPLGSLRREVRHGS